MIGRTLGFYFAGHFLRNVLLTFLLFFALITAVDLIDQTRRASKVEDGSFLDFLAISASRAAVLAENIWPFAALFGSMATLVVLNRRLELVVARAAGVSAWRFLLPAIASAVVLGLASAALYNPLVRWAEAAGKGLEAEIYGDKDTQGYTRDFWLRTNGGDGAQVIYARVSENRGRLLTGVSRYGFRADGASAGRIDAATFTFDERPGGNVWIATDAVVYGDEPEGRAVAELAVPAFADADRLSRAGLTPDDVPFWSLTGEATAAADAGQNPLPFWTRFQSLLARPLLFTAMVLLAGTCCLRFARFGQAARPVALGVVAGFVLYVVAEFVLSFGSNGVVAPWMAAWGPPLVASLAGVSVLLYQEDG